MHYAIILGDGLNHKLPKIQVQWKVK